MLEAREAGRSIVSGGARNEFGATEGMGLLVLVFPEPGDEVTCGGRGLEVLLRMWATSS